MTNSSTNTPRPSRTDGAATRARILETAGELIAANGFAQTPNKAIAAAAAVDLASINYHFGNRNGLYQAVLQEAHKRLISLERLQQTAQSGLSAEEKLAELMNQVVHNLLGNTGWPVRIMAQTLLQRSETLQLLESEVLPKAALVRQIAADISGLPADSIELRRCMLNIVSPMFALFLFQDGLPAPLRGIEQDSEALARHLCRFAVAGLKAAGSDR
ncbi:TetR/AcrR family transcriptional regulator [Neisseria perflava]|uniref:TetR/AcrR family transcriptional regulator n=1 Tax=Neisseria perflava TaxID=33053 RepID=UPI00209EA9A5|nr:TetR/AcrR family transcriptional regulator [Neisseria perflava]MCP1659404.1 AcrR family transcriptional regulator [Neisseria perflava]